MDNKRIEQINDRLKQVIGVIMTVVQIIITIGCLYGSAYLFARNIYPELEFPQELRRSDNAVVLEVNRLLEPEFELLVRTVYAEAGNQGYEGKRLVCACILNRVESDVFPDTITEVLEAPGQFSVIRTGAIYKYDLDDETIQACEDEMKERSNTEIIYFCSSGYVNGQPWQKVGDHYFSTARK